MNKNFGLIAFIVAAVLFAGSLYYIGRQVANFSDSLGVTVGPAAALSNQNLQNALHALAQDVYRVASSTGQGLRATASWNPPAISTSSQVATTTVTVPGAVLGDLALASFDSATSVDKWDLTAKVSAANTVLVAMRYLFSTSSIYDGTASLDLTASTLAVKVFQSASTTLVAATSTAIGD